MIPINPKFISNKMCEDVKTSYFKIFVHYEATAEIVSNNIYNNNTKVINFQVLGILSILYSLEIFLLSYKDEIFSIKYYWFIASAFFVLIKGGLLLYGIRNVSDFLFRCLIPFNFVIIFRTKEN